MDSKIFRRLDVPLVFATFGILLMSLIIIGSATHVNDPGSERFYFVQRQGLFALINIVFGLLFLNFFDYRNLQSYGNKLYIFNLVMLIAVMVAGQSALGAQRWIQIGPISLQPSEFSKLIMIICLASVLQDRVGRLDSVADFLPVFGYLLIPFVLVLKQPDLGTSLVFMAIFFGMIFVCGIKLRILFGIALLGVASFPIMWQFLKEYQKMRIMVFLDPNVDPLGSGYHIIQSKIAIGSGMIFGKGLFQGTQSQLNFLPENHTDFIFSVVGEELGFVGAVILLVLYLIIFWRGLQIAREADDVFGRLLAVGIISMLAFHVLVNVGMTTGIMPVTGIPLPLMSYGVSALTTDILSIAILLNIRQRKQKLFFE